MSPPGRLCVRRWHPGAYSAAQASPRWAGDSKGLQAVRVVPADGEVEGPDRSWMDTSSQSQDLALAGVDEQGDRDPAATKAGFQFVGAGGSPLPLQDVQDVLTRLPRE